MSLQWSLRTDSIFYALIFHHLTVVEIQVTQIKTQICLKACEILCSVNWATPISHYFCLLYVRCQSKLCCFSCLSSFCLPGFETSLVDKLVSSDLSWSQLSLVNHLRTCLSAWPWGHPGRTQHRCSCTLFQPRGFDTPLYVTAVCILYSVIMSWTVSGASESAPEALSVVMGTSCWITPGLILVQGLGVLVPGVWSYPVGPPGRVLNCFWPTSGISDGATCAFIPAGTTTRSTMCVCVWTDIYLLILSSPSFFFTLLFIEKLSFCFNCILFSQSTSTWHLELIKYEPLLSDMWLTCFFSGVDFPQERS